MPAKEAKLNSPNQLQRALEGPGSARWLSLTSTKCHAAVEGRALGSFAAGAARSTLAGRGSCSAGPSWAAARPRFLTILYNTYSVEGGLLWPGPGGTPAAPGPWVGSMQVLSALHLGALGSCFLLSIAG